MKGQGINLEDKLRQFDDRWAPRTVAHFNGHAVMVVKVKGEFVDEETHLLLIEPIGTPNTGNAAIAAPAREI
jgi:hypothetical protein